MFINRIYHFLFAALAAIMLSSCVKDPSGSGKGGGEEPGETGYFSISLLGDHKPQQTRAWDDYYKELDVDKVYVLLYNSAGNLKYGLDLKATLNGADYYFEGDDVETGHNGSYLYGFISKAQQVTKEEYSMVVLMNPPTALSDLESARLSTLTSLQAALTNITPEDLGAGYATSGTGQKFFISNINGPVPVSAADIYDTEGDAIASPVSVSVSRALAKIRLNWNQDGDVSIPVTDTEGKTIGRVNDIKWKPQTVNKSTYPLRKFAYVAEYSVKYPAELEDYKKSTELNDTWISLGVNYLSEELSLYAEDPNMAPGSHTEFTREDSAPTLEVNKYVQGNWDDSYFAYVTENTVDARMYPTAQTVPNWYEYITHVEMSVYMTIDAFGASDAFYSYNEGTAASPDWKLFTWLQAKRWLESNNFPSDMTRLQSILTAIQPEVNGQIGGWRVFDFWDAASRPVYTEAGDGIYYTQSRYKPTSIGTGDDRIFYHYQGVCQYRLPIIHFASRQDDYFDVEIPGQVFPAYPMDATKYGYYGAVRNNMYDIFIDKIMGPGGEGDLAYISACVTVNSWVYRNQSNELDPYGDL